MSCIPKHGRIACNNCFNGMQTTFDETKRTEGNWRITNNPLAWGNAAPEIIVLGFSKGPTQAGSLAATPHNDIAYKSHRKSVGKILAHIGLLDKVSESQLASLVDKEIADLNSRFHFASLIRCTVERYDENSHAWTGTGGGMLDKFVATSFGDQVSTNCAKMFLSNLPSTVRLIVMFGMGSQSNYVKAAFQIFSKVKLGKWEFINDVAYTDGHITVVHVEHFASQGALIPQWLGLMPHERSKLGVMAQAAVESALKSDGNTTIPKTGQPTRALSEVKEMATSSLSNPGTVLAQSAPRLSAGSQQEESSSTAYGKCRVTAANLKHKHIYLNSFISIFPKESIGGSNRADSARNKLTLRFSGLEPIQTDIAGDKKIFRDRSSVGEFYDLNQVKEGDELIIQKINHYEFHISKF